MKVLIVEDNEAKREDLILFFQKQQVDVECCEYVNDALKYIYRNVTDISGIILDLGLQSSKNSEDYSLYRGFDLIEELERKEWNIPVLINSTTFMGMLDEFTFIYGQRTRMKNYEMLEEFIAFLKKGEEQ